MSAASGLRDQLLGVLIDQPIVRDHHTVPITARDAHLLADALLPVVEAYARAHAAQVRAELIDYLADLSVNGKPALSGTALRMARKRADAEEAGR